MTSAREDPAGMAANIMFGKEYLDVVHTIYSEKSSIEEFEKNPKTVLGRHGIDIPRTIDVVIHRPGAVGRPARVDLHWKEEDQVSLLETSDDKDNLVNLARVAWNTLHSSEMRNLLRSVRASATALKDFTANPLSYARAHGVRIPDGLEVIVHAGHRGAPYVDIHFPFPSAMKNARDSRYDGGCCYCSDGACCYYAA